MGLDSCGLERLLLTRWVKAEFSGESESQCSQALDTSVDCAIQCACSIFCRCWNFPNNENPHLHKVRTLGIRFSMRACGRCSQSPDTYRSGRDGSKDLPFTTSGHLLCGRPNSRTARRSQKPDIWWTETLSPCRTLRASRGSVTTYRSRRGRRRAVGKSRNGFHKAWTRPSLSTDIASLPRDGWHAMSGRKIT